MWVTEGMVESAILPDNYVGSFRGKDKRLLGGHFKKRRP